MLVPEDHIALGLRWLLARDGHADEATIRTQIELATEPWLMACDLLQDDPALIALLLELWPQVVPFLIKGSHVSPVHHIAYVVQHMAQIAVGERLSHTDTRLCVLAALFHDIGIGNATRPKIAERTVREELDPEEQEHLRDEAIASRLEHMILGEQITRDILQRYTHVLSKDNINVICGIVRTHDNSKIPLLQPIPERKWFLGLTPLDWLMQCHWEADALWMLCPAGLAVDIERRKVPDTPTERRAQFLFNEQLHRDIVTLYTSVIDATTLAWYNFRDGLLYRTTTGYNLARHYRTLQGL